MTFTSFNPTLLYNKEIEKIAHFSNIIRKEEYPLEPPHPLVFFQNYYQRPFTITTRFFWFYKKDEEIIAMATAFIDEREDNQDKIYFNIRVHPSYRRQGIARSFIPILKDLATQHCRKKAFVNASDAIVSGAFFLNHIGAKLGSKSKVSDFSFLNFSSSTQNLIQNWIRSAPAENYEYYLNEGIYPEELIEPMCFLKELMDNAPHDAIQMEPTRYSPDYIRRINQTLEEQNILNILIYVKEKKTQNFVAYTEVRIFYAEPHIASQEDTGVDPKHQGQGIARWMKALMINHLKTHYPQIQIIRTNNVLSNDSMRRINIELGFIPVVEHSIWQLDLD